MPRAPAPLYACLLGLCTLVPRLPGLNECTRGSATSCEECLLIHPKCAWCSKENFGSLRSVTSRCDLKANLVRNGCEGELESPASVTQVLRSLPLSSKGSSYAGSDVIQMTPQEIAVNLRPGDKTTFQLQVRQVEDYPVDLYYLMDLSLSMKDDLDNIRSLGTKLAEEMRKLTSNFRLGFGSFVDKSISPFSYTAPRYQTNPCIGYKLFPNCVPSFGFRHLLPLTDRVDSFNEEVRKQRVSRNRDAPEGGFDAVLQAAVCKSIRSKVELSVWDQPEDLNLFFTATCQDGVSYPDQRKCEGLKIGDTASFEVSVEARSCPGKHAEHTFTLRPVGFRDSLEVGVTYNCRCGCSAGQEPDSPRCSGNGTYVCGLCECNPSYLGSRCECQEGENPSGHQNLCREAEGKPLCSGRGQCSCSQCSCFESEFGKIYGPFCECDNFSCARNRGVLCSGHGECQCGECKCHAGYVGDNCNCSTDISTCRGKEGRICSDRGHCVCGQCQCTEPGAFGETCEKCPTCPDACSTKRDCVECLLLHSGSSADNQTCQNLCKDEVITWADAIVKDDQEAVLCFYKTAKDCVMLFTYTELPSGKSNLTVLREPECGTAPNVTTILLAVVGSILLIGFVLLAIWKLLVTIHDRREFAKFQSERSRARYEMASNPLYRKPISTHAVDFTFNKLNKSYNGTVD
ncbi:integrin beta-5 isoform X2 [Eptesicus fuscus]|uniref:integrin beta-5 isoform X2 n=1 Tax=Eptesicus fuscus TaxID=29078 RepID=UPI0024043EE2|nr:integrin beta-5 isoform X2 [Eptesicus fuscus]